MILCFDVGGTNTKHCLMDENETIIEHGSFPTEMNSLDEFIDSLLRVFEKNSDTIEGIAVSMPGVIDENGFCYTGGALDKIVHELDLRKLLSEKAGIPVSVCNDAKAAACGELNSGALKDVNDGIVLVLGTGVGGCLIKDHKIIYGNHLMAGEFSFVNLGLTKDFSDMLGFRCGSAGLLQRVKEKTQKEEELSGKVIFALANEGDDKVLEALHDFCYDLACFINNLQVIYDPELFAVGGGISAQPLLFEMLDRCFDEIRDTYGGLVLMKPKVVHCVHYNDANLIGAYHMFKNKVI